MPRQKLDGYWRDKIHEMAESKPRPSANAIERRLAEIAVREKRDDYPSIRTIGRVLQEHRAMTEEQRAIYREFHWPPAMVTFREELPWEASRVALDVLKDNWYREQRRPSVRRVVWHWRVSLAIPGASVEDREPYVNGILASESIGQLPSGPMDWMLAFESWNEAGNRKLAEAMPDGYPENMTGGE